MAQRANQRFEKTVPNSRAARSGREKEFDYRLESAVARFMGSSGVRRVFGLANLGTNERSKPEGTSESLFADRRDFPFDAAPKPGGARIHSGPADFKNGGTIKKWRYDRPLDLQRGTECRQVAGSAMVRGET